MSGRYVTPLDPALAALVTELDEADREAFEEMAGVREHMGHFSRRQAEALAWQDLLDLQQRRRAADAAPQDPDGSAA